MYDATALVQYLTTQSLTICTMESCTGGAVIHAITNVSGSSKITQGGYVTYSNEQKMRVGVPKAIIEEHGVYSQKCAEAMALVGVSLTGAQIGVGVTGTFSNQDEMNGDSVPGEVHYAVIMGENAWTKTITVPFVSRTEQKDAIVSAVLDDVYEMALNEVRQRRGK